MICQLRGKTLKYGPRYEENSRSGSCESVSQMCPAQQKHLLQELFPTMAPDNGPALDGHTYSTLPTDHGVWVGMEEITVF